MCIASKPKTTPAPPPPKVETVESTGNVAANREAENRRRRYALSRQQTQGGGAMQGSGAVGGKGKLGE